MNDHVPAMDEESAAPGVGEVDDRASAARAAYEELLAPDEDLLASYAGRVDSPEGEYHRVFGVTDRQAIDYEIGERDGHPKTTVRATTLADVRHVFLSVDGPVSTWSYVRLGLGVLLVLIALALLGSFHDSFLTYVTGGTVVRLGSTIAGTLIGTVLLVAGGYLVLTARDSESGGVVVTLELGPDGSKRYTLPEEKQYVARQVVNAVGEANAT